MIYGIFTDTPAFGARVRREVVDTVAKWHLTDEYKAAAGQYDIHETALWKGKRKGDWRIIGPKSVTFAQPSRKGCMDLQRGDGRGTKLDTFAFSQYTEIARPLEANAASGDGF